jgi:hypothetical protein
MAMKLNRKAFNHAKELIDDGNSCSMNETHGASTSRQRSKRMTSSSGMDLKSTGNVIWASTTRGPKTPKDTMSSRTAISRTPTP